MARLPRVVCPGLPHDVTQPGNRRERTIFDEGDNARYPDLPAESSARARADVRANCPIPIHVHIIPVPSDRDGLRRTSADLHRRTTGFTNARERTTGHSWQGRSGLEAMDETHPVTAVRHVTLDGVRVRLVKQARDRP